MEQTVEYRMSKCEFGALVEYLNGEKKYGVHGYKGMPKGTIDDGSSTYFEDCKRFSTFQYLGGGESVILQVKDSRLAQTVNAYFAGN